MSASREKKSRQESLAGGYVDPRTKREKDEQAKDRRSNALYIAIAVIFVIVGIVVTVANSKVIERNADAVTIGNETYTAADVSYFYNTIYSSFVSKNSYYLSAYGLDTSKSLKEQDCPVTDGGTWYDYFRDQALESLKSYALLAQKAEAEGFDGSEEVEQSVQDTRAKVRHRNLVSVRKAESEPQIYIFFILHHRSPFAADISRRLLHPGQDGFHLFMQAVILQNEYSLVVSYEMY